jgi:hypothetical protein
MPDSRHRPPKPDPSVARPALTVDRSAASADLGPLLQLLARLAGDQAAEQTRGAAPAARREGGGA